MNAKEVARQKQNAELMVLDALRTFTQMTKRRIHSIEFDFEPEPDGVRRVCHRVTLNLDEDE